MTEKLFKLKQNNTTVKTEIAAGITTFMPINSPGNRPLLMPKQRSRPFRALQAHLAILLKA